MMPGIGFTEMILLVVVAIVVIGPKDLPLMMRKFGKFTGQMRALAFEFRQGIDELGRQAELEELRKEVAELKKSTGIDELQSDLQQEHNNFHNDVSNSAQLEAVAAGSETPENALPAPADAARHEAQDVAEIQPAAAAEDVAAQNPYVAGVAYEAEDYGGLDAGAPVDMPSPAGSKPAIRQDEPA